MDKKFIITPKAEKTVTMTIRIEAETNRLLEELALQSGRSRNELINKALEFAFDNLEFTAKGYNQTAKTKRPL